MLPGIDGFDICKEFKGSATSSKSFLIMVSVKGEYNDRLYACLLGADYYLTNPFSIKNLIEIVKETRSIKNRQFIVRKKGNFT